MQDIANQRSAAFAPIQEKINLKQIERDHCTSFACAEKCKNELDLLNNQLMGVHDNYARKETAAGADATRQGRAIAMNAYVEELDRYLRFEMPATLLSHFPNQPCASLPIKPGPASLMTCSLSLIEFRNGNDFYQTKLAYGFAVTEGAQGVDYMRVLFSRSRAHFLQAPGLLEASECSLYEALGKGCGQNFYFLREAGGDTFRFADPSRVGFLSVDVRHSP